MTPTESVWFAAGYSVYMAISLINDGVQLCQRGRLVYGLADITVGCVVLPIAAVVGAVRVARAYLGRCACGSKSIAYSQEIHDREAYCAKCGEVRE